MRTERPHRAARQRKSSKGVLARFLSRLQKRQGTKDKPMATQGSKLSLQKELSGDFPQLELETIQLPDGGWVVASAAKPLTEKEATQILIAYGVVRELIKPQA